VHFGYFHIKYAILFLILSISTHRLSADNCISRGDSVILNSQRQVDSFALRFPGCTTVRGKLIIKGNDITNLFGLSALSHVESLNIRDNINLTNLRGLNNLQTAGFIDISHNESLLSLHGLEGLDSVTTHMEVKYNATLVTMDGLNSLQKVKGTLTVFSNASLLNLDGLDAVKQVSRLVVYGNPSLTTLAGIDSMLRLRNIDVWVNETLTCCTIVNNLTANNPNLSLNNIFLNSTGCNNQSEITASLGQVCCKTDFTVNIQSICAGGSIAVGGNIYTAAGIYIDTFSTVQGCDSIVFTELSIGQRSLTTVERTLCNGQQFVLSNGTVIERSGTYRDTIPFTCDSVIEYILRFTDNSLTVQEKTACEGSSYLLPGGNTVTETGTYTDTVFNAAGCDSVFITTVTFLPNRFEVSLPAEISIISGDSVQLLPSYSNGTAISWYWQPENGLYCTNCERPFVSPATQTTYLVRATDGNGCADTASAAVSVQETDLYVPEVFSPNGDQINDELDIFVSAPASFSIKVFNRYGELVFQSTDISQKWDGTFKNKTCPVDTYIYTIDAELFSQQKIHKQGTVLLLR
jgi:gliding motility-associated-like protein